MSDQPNNPGRITRRTWLESTAAGLAAAATGCQSFQPAGPRAETAVFDAPAPRPPSSDPMPRIDAHVHLFAEDEARFPLHENAPYVPDHRAPVERYVAHMDAAGIQGAVLVHPEPYQDDHRYVRHCLEHAPDRFRATCLFDPDDTATLPALMALCDRPGFVALRIHAVREDRLPAFDTPVLRDIWQTAGQLGLALQLNSLPRYLPRFVPLIESFPRIPVVIDHLGQPGTASDEERSHILRLSALPNVYLKFSGLKMASREPFPHTDLKPFLEGVVDLFGPDRMMWGGGYRGEPYGDAAKVVDLLLDFVDTRGRAMISGGTAMRLFRFV